MKITQIEVQECDDKCLLRENHHAYCNVPDESNDRFFTLRKKDESFPGFCPLLKGVVVVTKGEQK